MDLTVTIRPKFILAAPVQDFKGPFFIYVILKRAGDEVFRNLRFLWSTKTEPGVLQMHLTHYFSKLSIKVGFQERSTSSLFAATRKNSSDGCPVK